MIELTDQHIKNYRFDLLAKQLYEFVWNEYCDWYLELTKPILADELPHIQHATRYSLVKILELTLRLLHPIIPFITEEIWQQVAPKIGIQAETISNQSYPTVEQQWLDTDSEQKVEWLKQIITGIRSIRSEMNIAPSKHIKLILQHGSSEDHQQIADNEKFLQTLVKISSIEWLSNDAKPPISATCVVGTLQLLIPLAGLVDKNAEIARLNKAIAKLEKDLQVINQKLGNEHFVAKAPENLVHAERENQQAMSYQLTVLQKKIEQIKTID